MRLTGNTLAILVAVVLAATICGGTFYWVKRDDRAEPDLRSMRAHRVSLMTDEEVRAIHAQAVTDAIRYKAMDQDMREKAFKEVAASAQLCSDFVYRERHSAECSRGTPLGLMLESNVAPTSDQVFEEKILGICRFVHSNQDARLNRCLPPK
ncbi:hypothetical protein [Bradyrhizobium sp. LB13.1]